MASRASTADDAHSATAATTPSPATSSSSDVTTAAIVTPRASDAHPMQAPSAHQHQRQQSSSIAYSMSQEIKELADAYKHATRSSFNAAKKASHSENDVLPFSFAVDDGEPTGIKLQPTDENGLRNEDDA